MLKRTVLTAAVLGLALVGCEDRPAEEDLGPPDTLPSPTADDVKRETAEAGAVLFRYSQERYDAFRAEMRQRLATAQAQLQSLREQAAEASGDARMRMQDAIERAEEQRAELAERLEELEVTGERAWTDVETGFEAAWRDLEAALEDAWARFVPPERRPVPPVPQNSGPGAP